jgi:cytoskeletal protein RodZ
MFRPVGSLPPSVYWRRRFVLLALLVALIVLLVVTLSVVLSGNSDSTQGAHGASPGTPTQPPPATHHRHSSSSSTPTEPSTPHTTTRSDSSAASTDTAQSSDSASPPARCTTKQLALVAESDQTHYTMSENPQLSMLVTNEGSEPCVQDLADPQVILSVYNGEARVWGSHDCKVEPGTNDQTLMPGRSVRVSITWSGLSSKPHCAGTRQRVGAGSYTLYATLAGHEAKSAQFTIG